MTGFTDVEDALRFRAKAALRGQMRTLRAAHPARVLAERSARIVASLCAHPDWAAARCVALFRAMAEEVDLAAAAQAMTAERRRWALPVVTRDASLTFREAGAEGRSQPLVRSAFGIEEPADTAPEVPLREIDLVVVPALAVDLRGHRLGYGRGYYDRTLEQMPDARKIVVAFDFQLIAEVPMRAGDVACDWVITDRRSVPAEPA